MAHTAAVDMEGPILAAEVIAFLLQQRSHAGCFDEFVDVLCSYFSGRGGQAPTKGDLTEAARFRSALGKWNDCRLAKGKAVPANSVLQATFAVHEAAAAVALTGQPDGDWTAIRSVLEDGACTRLAEVAKEARNVRLLLVGAARSRGR
ncbi:DNA helicase UvrD [Mesorhizobium sp. LSHC414A00]|nr:DNA helicase UvrD [Mesorhizobium sp. LSHC414A00]ESZ54440.1 DNA helicase UvrD [Mesorhizobium sp. L103C131B0]